MKSGDKSEYKPIPPAVLNKLLSEQDINKKNFLYSDGTLIPREKIKVIREELSLLKKQKKIITEDLILCPNYQCEKPIIKDVFEKNGCPHCKVILKPLFFFPEVTLEAQKIFNENVRLLADKLVPLLKEYKTICEENKVLWKDIVPVKNDISTILNNISSFEKLTKVITVAVAGEKNRGKSTLSNILLGIKDDLVFPTLSVTNTSCPKEVRYNFTRILDLPGTESLKIEHDEAVKKTIDEADVVVYMLSPGGNLLGPEYKFLKNYVYGNNRERKILFVLNKIDEIKSSDDVSKEIEKIKQWILFGKDGFSGICSITDVTPDFKAISTIWYRDGYPENVKNKFTKWGEKWLSELERCKYLNEKIINDFVKKIEKELYFFLQRFPAVFSKAQNYRLKPDVFLNLYRDLYKSYITKLKFYKILLSVIGLLTTAGTSLYAYIKYSSIDYLLIIIPSGVVLTFIVYKIFLHILHIIGAKDIIKKLIPSCESILNNFFENVLKIFHEERYDQKSGISELISAIRRISIDNINTIKIRRPLETINKYCTSYIELIEKRLNDLHIIKNEAEKKYKKVEKKINDMEYNIKACVERSFRKLIEDLNNRIDNFVLKEVTLWNMLTKGDVLEKKARDILNEKVFKDHVEIHLKPELERQIEKDINILEDILSTPVDYSGLTIDHTKLTLSVLGIGASGFSFISFILMGSKLLAMFGSAGGPAGVIVGGILSIIVVILGPMISKFLMNFSLKGIADVRQDFKHKLKRMAKKITDEIKNSCIEKIEQSYINLVKEKFKAQERKELAEWNEIILKINKVRGGLRDVEKLISQRR